MKKKTLKKGIMLLAVSTLSVSMLSGCSLLKPTANSLLKSCERKMQAVDDMGLDGKVDFAMELSKDGTSIDVDFNADMDIMYEKEKDGFESYMDTEIELSMMGVSQKINGETYSVGNEKTITTYSKSEDEDEWTKEVEEIEDSDSSVQSFADVNFDSFMDKMTLEEETKEVYGRECYVLKGEVKDSDLSGMLDEMDMEDIGDVDLDEVQAEVILNIDKKDKMPVSIIMEIDNDIFNKTLEKSDLDGVTITVDSFQIEIIYREINTGKTVDIPKEVFDASEKKDSGDNDFFGNIENEDDDEVEPEDDNDDEVKPEEDDDGDEVEPEDDDGDEVELEDDDTSEDDEEISFGQGTMSEKEFKAEGFEFVEFIQENDQKIYLKVQNNNKKQVNVSVYASFLKDGKIVDDDFAYVEFEPTTFQVVDFNIDTDYDEVEYTFEVDDLDSKDLIGTQMDVFYTIEDDTVSGTVTNESLSEAKFIEVHIVLYNEDKEIIEHDYGFVEADEVQPSETSDYSIYLEHTDYDSYEIYANAYTD